MTQQAFSPNDFFKTACWFEGSLLVIALIIGWLTDVDPFQTLSFSETAVLYGIYGAAPLFLLFMAMQQAQFDAMQEIRRLLLETLGPYLAGYHWTDLLVLSVVAGVSEEVLFRGVLQPWIELSWGITAGLIISNLLFGLVHAVTPLYAVLAALMGAYLSWFMDYGESRNLLTPVIIHAVYDFFAFIMLARAYNAIYKGE